MKRLISAAVIAAGLIPIPALAQYNSGRTAITLSGGYQPADVISGPSWGAYRSRFYYRAAARGLGSTRGDMCRREVDYQGLRGWERRAAWRRCIAGLDG